MTRANQCTAQKFKQAWCDVWSKEDESLAISNQFSGTGTWTAWTDRMLKSDSAFLCKVVEKLGFSRLDWKGESKRVYKVEYDRIDMVLMSDYNEGYPYSLDVVIEHENSKDVENEMWKLMLLRSPLKVIVFYSHKDNAKGKTEKMLELLCKANAAFPENHDTEYLFIVGSVGRDAKMQWHWASDKEPSLTQLC